MRVTRSLVLSSFCTLLLATAAAAQGAFPPAVQTLPSASTSPRGAWLERFQESRSGPESAERWSRTFKVGPNGSLDLSNISGDIVITGGAGDETAAAVRKGLDAYVSGEGAHHNFFDAEEGGVNLLLGGHYATETFGVRALAKHLEEKFGLEWTFIDHPTGL